MLSLYALTIVRTGNSKAGFVASGILFLLAGLSFSLRPQMLGYLFLILTLIVLERFRQGHANAVWFLPAIMLLWVNTHGSWIIGMGIIFVYWMCGLVEFRAENLEARRWTQSQAARISFAFLLCLLTLPDHTLWDEDRRLSVRIRILIAAQCEIHRGMAIDAVRFSRAANFSGARARTIFGSGNVCVSAGSFEDVALFLFGTTMACLHVRFLLIFVPLFAPLFGDDTGAMDSRVSTRIRINGS